jgi:lipopolysaccharide export LptBFGC system permease protein LptF|tara:strand:- start:131 stop:475 length:345 start_codon:yes stop_codon:yes gene_type:complete
MNDKTVEPNSELNKLDTNGDNVISQEEYEQSERRIRLELLKNEDQKQDQQLRMIWYSLISLLIFPILLIFSSLYGLDDAGKNLTEMSSIFFLTIGGLVSVFFGSQAIKKNGNGR